MRYPGATAATDALPLSSPGDVLSVLEILASEHPEAVATVVATLALSPARSALLELMPLFQVEVPAEIAGAVVTVASQLDRLERQPRWTEPREVLGNSAAGAVALDAFARRRADRWRRNHGAIRPPRLVRVDRCLRRAAGLERARALVDGFLNG